MSNWNYAEVIEAIAEIQPHAPAITQGDRTLSWEKLEQESRALAQWLLDQGLSHQETVAQYLYNCPEYLIGVIATMRAGLVPVNTNYRYGTEELSYLWDNADARVVIFHGSFVDTVASMKDAMPKVVGWLFVDDGSTPCPTWATNYRDVIAQLPAVIERPAPLSGDDLLFMYTGGTTGMPKGVMWRQDDLLCRLNVGAYRRWDLEAGIEAMKDRLRELGPGLPLLPACPLMHGTGQFQALESLIEGGHVILLESRHYDPAELAATIDAKHVAQLIIVGDPFARPLVAELQAHPGKYHFDSLKSILSTGAMFSQDMKDALAQFKPRLLLIDSLGSSEAIGVGTSLSRGKETATTGTFTVSKQVRVLDEDNRDVVPGSGEIGMVALGGRVPLGYYKDEAKTAATFRVIDGNRYSIPGDYATVSPDGTVNFMGRGSQCINTAGEKVYPEEVEEVLKRHESVADACVVGVPDERYGEVVVGIVELIASAPRPDAEALTEHVRQHLARYKAPRSIRFVDTIGRSPSGKMDYARHKREAIEFLANASNPS